MSSSFKRYLVILFPVVIGIGLLFIPLLGDFHLESAVLASLVGCFWAAVKACNRSDRYNDFFHALRVVGILYLAGLPLVVNALLTGCFSIHGLAFWLLFPLPGVYFGYAIGRLLRAWNISYRRSVAVGVLVIIGIGIFLYEFFTYPQVYFFNHVWGGWPGPIYDETVRINGATVFFRMLTLLWAVLLWHIPTIDRDQWSKWIVALSAVAVAFAYTQLNEIGVISPASHIQNKLGGQYSTAHFELYYDRDMYSKDEIRLLAKEHEFYLNQISQQLNLDLPEVTEKIESYLYGHAWQKKKLVGAKFTSYVPVWLKQDQLHIARQQIDSSLWHELVHLLAKQFGNRLFNASWSIGMIEGLAVAIAGGPSPTSTIDQIVVSEKPYPTADELKNAFSPLGFYGGRSGVNYVTTGSFVRFLMQKYPIASLKEAYRTGNIAKSYPKDWQTLTKAWHQHLDSVAIDSLDLRIARRIFGIPSLFEQECPHVVSDFAAAWDRYRLHMASRDTTAALRYLDHALSEADSLAGIKAEWSYRQLVAGHAAKVQRLATRQDTSVELQLLYADAFAADEEWKQANAHLERAQHLFVQKPDSLLEPAIAVRTHRPQWDIYRRMTYARELPDSATFARAFYRTKIRSLRQARDRDRWNSVKEYAQQLVRLPLHQQYFDDYQQTIHQLAFMQETELAASWIEKVSAMNLRQRYRERLQQERRWLAFLKS